MTVTYVFDNYIKYFFNRLGSTSMVSISSLLRANSLDLCGSQNVLGIVPYIAGCRNRQYQTMTRGSRVL